MTGRHKLELAETSVLRQETNTTVPRLALSLQDTVKAEMSKRARARRASPKDSIEFPTERTAVAFETYLKSGSG
jgi:hypothetical protein